MKHNLWITMVAAASLTLWSCSQAMFDTPRDTDSDTDVSDATTAGYIAIRLEDAEVAGTTRADGTHKEYDDDYVRFEWFNKGTADERAIIENPACNRVLFFKKDGSYVGSFGLEKPSIKTQSTNIYVAQTPLDESRNVAYAMVVLNAAADRMVALDQLLLNDRGTAAVKEALTYINTLDNDIESLAQTKDSDGKKYFTMSSTVYRSEDSDHVAVLTELNPDGPVFFETEEEAIRPENLTTFYVERILSKFTLLIKDPQEGNKRFSDYTGPITLKGPNKFNVRRFYVLTEDQQKQGVNKDVMTDWKINLVNWGLNGLEKNTYLVKQLVETPGTSYPEGWKVPGNFYTGWNSPTLFRSYWGIDENYKTGFYPYQYRLALDEDGVKSATKNTIYSSDFNEGTGLEENEYTLVYKPYSSFVDRTENKYSVENTFDPYVLSGQDLATDPWLRCGTHIILTAQLIFDEFDKNLKAENPGFIEGVSDKYFSNGLWWNEDALLQQAVATLMTNIYYNKKDGIPDVINGGFIEYVNKDDHPLDNDCPMVDANNTRLTHEYLMGRDANGKLNVSKYFELAPAFIKGGDGWVTLKKKDGVTLKMLYENGETGKITDAQLVSYIYHFTNLAKHFKEGRMYYAIPIRHNLESLSFESSPVTAVRTGDYGVVRNTWYRLTVTSIDRPGTPVDDPEQPIIPNPEPDQKSLGVEVEVIPWRTINIEVDQLY